MSAVFTPQVWQVFLFICYARTIIAVIVERRAKIVRKVDGKFSVFSDDEFCCSGSVA